MRTFIRWIFFEGDNIRQIIKNDENNENWPNARKFSAILKEWRFETNNQQQEINQIEIKNNKTRQIMSEVQSWFRNEYNLLSKPAKRAWLLKQNELRILERELQVHQYNLDHPKEKLEEHEKQCLLNKIRVGKRKTGNCKDELEEAEKAYENEKRELCQRLSYTKDDIPQPFLRNPEERIDPLTRRIITTSEDYHKWWRKFCDIDDTHSENLSHPLNELEEILNEWYDHNEGKGPEENPYEIYVEEKTDDSLIFVWRPIEREIEQTDDKGKKEKVKGRYLALCKNYLFNYYGEWYEVSDYTQLNYNLIVVECQRSIFYNDYWGLLRSQANLILHHSTMGRGEICSCPSYEVYTSKNKFILDYKLKFDAYRLSKEEEGNRWHVKDESINIISGECPVIVKDIDKEWEKITNIFESIIGGIGDAIAGEKAILYFLLSKRLYEKTKDSKGRGGIWTHSWFLCPNKEETLPSGTDMAAIYFKRAGRFDKNTKVSRLRDEDLDDFLEEKGLWKEEMYHFRRTHIKAVLYWREMKIWEGNYWDLRNEGIICESVSPSGNCVTFLGSGRVLAKVHELITIKVGRDKGGLLGILVTTGTSIASAWAGGVAAAGVKGAVAKTVAATSAKALTGAVGGMAQLAHNELMNTPTYSENTQFMTFHEFRHKYLFGKDYPITLWIEYNQELANQYLNKQELKGPMFYNYTNLDFMGRALSQKDFFKASVISWNMSRNSEWFRSKIEEGRYLYDDDYQSFYKKKLSDNVAATSEGGIVLGDWDEFVVMGGTGEKILITADITNADYSNADYIGSPTPALWDEIRTKFIPVQSLHPGNNPVPNNCLGCLCGGGSHGNPNYSFSNTLNATVGGEIWLKTRGSSLQKAIIPSGGGKILMEARGNTAWIKLVGDKPETIKNPSGIPQGIPPSKPLPTDPTYNNDPSKAAPFNPNQFPSSGNLMPNPTGSGETEFNIPEIDNSPDPDWDQGLDSDTGIDPEDDPTQDPDRPTDPEIPPDTPPDDDND